MATLYGMNVSIRPSEPEKTRRSWRQRLFTRPWRPWVSETKNPEAVERNKTIYIAKNTVLVTAEVFDELKHLEELTPGYNPYYPKRHDTPWQREPKINTTLDA